MPNIHISFIKGLSTTIRATLMIVALAALGGCGGIGDVEFKGKLFDAVGMNKSSSTKTPKMAQRSGLVTPPSLDRLPVPGSTPPPVQGDDLASINDPDRVARESAEDLARRQKAYCDKYYEPGRRRGDASVEGIEGPAGPCRETFFTAIKKANAQK